MKNTVKINKSGYVYSALMLEDGRLSLEIKFPNETIIARSENVFDSDVTDLYDGVEVSVEGIQLDEYMPGGRLWVRCNFEIIK